MRVYSARWVVPVSSPPVPYGAVAVDDAGRITGVFKATRIKGHAEKVLQAVEALPAAKSDKA